MIDLNTILIFGTPAVTAMIITWYFLFHYPEKN